ncbi:MAG: protein phosphatase CheZ [Rhodospirillales bacterium]
MPDSFERKDLLLAERLAVIRAKRPQAEPDLVTEVVRAVLTTMSEDLTVHDTALLLEVEELGRTIANAKIEIAALKVDDINGCHIPFATDELDAIVAHTASATDAILESCETLDNLAGTVSGEAADKLQEATTRIYEACSFQDITGQRITKVVGTLKTIEDKVARIIATFGHKTAGLPAPPSIEHSAEEDLLNGPQLPCQAMDQSDIDKLMASFD